MLDKLARYSFFCLFDGYTDYNRIALALEEQEKTTFTCPYETFTFRRIPYYISMVYDGHFLKYGEKKLEIFMEEFFFFRDCFHECLHHLSLILMRYGETNLVLN